MNSAFDDDDENPWRWIGTAKIGQPSEVIVVGDRFGPMKLSHPVVLLDDGKWFNIDPPSPLGLRPVAWRYLLQKPKGTP